MPASNSTMIHKLQSAINGKGGKIVINRTQFYSEDQDRPITIWVVKKAIWDDRKNRQIYVELFSSVSQIQIVLFLRDLWYEINGWEVPNDNETWNTAKQAYIDRRKGIENGK